MGIFESTYAEVKKQELEQNPYRCLQNTNIDINPHQVEAFIFALASIKMGGAILADEVGLGKTIEAGLIIKYLLMSGKRKILLIMPSNLRKQWQLELEQKFNIDVLIVDSINMKEYSYELQKKQSVIAVSYHFATKNSDTLSAVAWDFCVFDEAHRMRNVHKNGSKMANTIYMFTKDIPKIMLTATPMQNTLFDLYGLIQFIDNRVFYSKSVFSERYIKNEMYEDLKNQLAPIVQRTLRCEVTDYIQFSRRKEMTVDFELSPTEKELYVLINQYLKKEILYALPNSHRKLVTSVIRKLLASSSMAIAETFEVLKKRLEKLKESTRQETAEESLDYFFDFLEDEDFEKNQEYKADELYTREKVNEFIQHEMDEIDVILRKAESIEKNAKMTALKKALKEIFEFQVNDNISEKAIVFTESLRTQQYIYDELSQSGYEGKILMFNGSMSDKATKEIYHAWKARNYKGYAGSRNVEIKNAIVEAFRDEYKILLVTDSGSEGLNLQFCSTVINYDLPWNPQKIEQRIGRCHRYGQTNDVVVINFLNTQNEADRRVYEILSKKFELFQGVFGASDKALGLLESGIDFEKRVAQIYQECDLVSEFTKQFTSLEKELDRKRNKKMEELQRIISKRSEFEHKEDFKKIFFEIEKYNESTNYWKNVSTEINSQYPLSFRVTGGLNVEKLKHGYIIIGSYNQGSVVITPVCQVIDEIGNFLDLQEEGIRSLLCILDDSEVEESISDNLSIIKFMDKLEERLYQYFCSINNNIIKQHERKVENWVALRKEEYIAKSKDIEKIVDIENQYEAETDFRAKIQLKRELEKLHKEQQKMQQRFHNEMSAIDDEANEIKNTFVNEIMKKPQLFIKMIVKF